MKELYEFLNNPNFAIGCAFGFVLGCVILEPLIINNIYFSNIALFRDIILTKKNRKKLDRFYGGNSNDK